MLSVDVGAVLRQSAIERDQPRSELRVLMRRVEHGDVVAAARHHRIVGCVRRALHILGEPTPPELEHDYSQVLARHVISAHEAHRLGRVLRDAGLPWLVFKGPVLAESAYRHPGLRSYSDVDVLVRPQDLGAAVTSLEAHDFTLLDSDWARFHALMLGEVHLRSPQGIPIDLHWTLLNTRRAREQFDLRTSAMFDRTTQVKVAGMSMPTFDAVDTLLHLALHACSSGGDLLVWLKDIEQVALRDPDWDAVVERARQRRIGPQVAVMLRRTSKVLELPIPHEVLRGLDPSLSWRLVGAVADYLSPVHRMTGSGCPARIVARATRTGPASSAYELARRSVAWTTTSVRRQPEHLQGSNIKLSSSSAETDQERASFIAAVAAQA